MRLPTASLYCQCMDLNHIANLRGRTELCHCIRHVPVVDNLTIGVRANVCRNTVERIRARLRGRLAFVVEGNAGAEPCEGRKVRQASEHTARGADVEGATLRRADWAADSRLLLYSRRNICYITASTSSILNSIILLSLSNGQKVSFRGQRPIIACNL